MKFSLKYSIMQGVPYEFYDTSYDKNHYAAGRKRVKCWLLGTAAIDPKSSSIPKALYSGSRCFEEGTY